MKALITGASSGIGAGIARLLSEKGYETVLVARREDKLLSVQKTLKTKSEIYTADLCDIKELERLVEAYPDIDILVNNAGMGVFGEFTETDFDRESTMIDVNIRALHFLMKKYIPLMAENGGKILNVASAAAFCPGPLLSSYYASKAYVLRLSAAVREELRQKKIPVTVTVLCPGPVLTGFDRVSGSKPGKGAISADEAASCAVKAMLKGKSLAIPTFRIKCSTFFSKMLPEKLLVKIIYKFQSSKRR